MTNSRGDKGKLVLLDNHLATGTEATYTFTKALDMKTVYRELLIIITGKATAALQMSMKISAGTDYNNVWLLQDSTTVSGSIADADSVIAIGSNTLIDGAVPFNIRTTVTLNDANDFMQAFSQQYSTHEGLILFGNDQQTTSTSISSIEIKTSTSTWIAGTEISIYGLRR